MHDLRRTMGSYQTETGASMTIIAKALGHKSLAATAVYARLSIEPVRNAFGKAVTAIRQHGGLLPAPVASDDTTLPDEAESPESGAAVVVPRTDKDDVYELQG